MSTYSDPEEHRDRAAQRSQSLSRLARDIAPDYPPAGDLKRRDDCSCDLRRFLEVYFPAAFYLRWSPDHLRVIGALERCATDGGYFALAMPRGSGKTSLVERAALWALLYGHKQFVCLVASTEGLAESMLARIFGELQTNHLLMEDFRQVCYPILRLENSARRCKGQLFRGEPTYILWEADKLVLPTLPDDACDGTNVSGSVITARGLTGALRGQSHRLASGKIIRPDLVLLDDPQTRESAMSPHQCDEREAIVRADVLGMAGPGQTISAIMPCTVIRAGDLADRMLDRARNPQWQGERTKAVYSWPVAEKRWEEYHQIRRESQRNGRRGAEATVYYKEHRKEMDAGASVAWTDRFDPGEISAIQHVQNKRADLGESAFSAEYQNDPMSGAPDEVLILSAADICRKTNRLPRGVLPTRAVQLTAFVDIHDALHFWCVCAWEPDFSGSVVDYGVYPRQGRPQFTLRKASPTLQDVAPGAGREGAIRAGLERVLTDLLAREWHREDGYALKVGRCLVDSGYVPEIVREVCRRSMFGSVLVPSRGVGVGASTNPMADWAHKPGELHGENWILTPLPTGGRGVRFDTNSWKSFVHARLFVAMGDKGCLSLFGHSFDEHSLFADHLTAEAPYLHSAKGRTAAEWSARGVGLDNHWLDCLVGCAVGASMLGIKLGVESKPNAVPTKRETSKERQQRKQRERQSRQEQPTW